MENQKLATWKIPKLLWSLAFPAICAQIVTLLYNLVDRIYIGQMENGAIAMAAIGICAPIVTVVTAFTGIFGRGVFAVVLAEPISDILTALTNAVYFRHFLRKKLPTEKNAAPAA